MEPFHDYIRPSPAAVLAEAAKQTELKTGHPLKGVDIPPQDGRLTNGHAKKDDKAPSVKEAPEIVSRFFDSMFDLTLLHCKLTTEGNRHAETIHGSAIIAF